jgi:Marseilleviridae restriction endonuclease
MEFSLSSKKNLKIKSKNLKLSSIKNINPYEKKQIHPYCGKKNCECSFGSSPMSKLWHPTKNGNVTPGDIPKTKSKYKYYFICDVCNHEFQQIAFNLYYGIHSCLQCSKRDWKHCKDENCQFCFNRSFASHEKSEWWHPIKNNITPLYVSKTC